jgi:hypothetical protein
MSRGHYESFYVKASHPVEPLALWIRYTVHKAPGAAPVGSLWSTFFDDRAKAPLAAKETFPAPRRHETASLCVGDSCISPVTASGAALGHEWDLAWTGDAGPVFHLPRPWMYELRLPRTKVCSPFPEISVTGSLRVGGRDIDVDGWPGMMGHNWGTQHAERWVWLSAWFSKGSWLDVACGRIRLGSWTTPWIANGAISLDGVRRRVGGLTTVRDTVIEDRTFECDFVLPGERVVSGHVERAPRTTVAWIYADPDGPPHHALNCSLAAMTITVDGRTLVTDRAVYETGVRETDHGVPVQPFGDGDQVL